MRPRGASGLEASMIETALRTAIAPICASPCPPRLAAAVEHAVFSGGSRVRPKLCLGVFQAVHDGGFNGHDRALDVALATAAATALELLHCASLVHDDLPCFDDAATRRGQPSVHAAYGEPLAVLAGDALIVRALELLGCAIADGHPKAAAVFSAVTQSVGMPGGITAGQAWECEPEDAVDLAAYHRAKTGALFTAACASGALAAGRPAGQWRRFGELMGEAYQVADDLKDCLLDEAQTGKPAQQDCRNGRPNAVLVHGVDGAQTLLLGHLSEAADLTAACAGGAPLRRLLAKIAEKTLRPERARDFSCYLDGLGAPDTAEATGRERHAPTQAAALPATV
jgi:geranylgeranyl diphosphate synthase type II